MPPTRYYYEPVKERLPNIELVEIADPKDFFDGKQLPLIKGVLNRIAQDARPEELGASTGTGD